MRWFLSRLAKMTKLGSAPPAHRASLAVECLEERVVLNALPPSYSLSGGNLYHVTSSAKVMLDSGVSSASVQTINGTDYVYDLRSTGQLWRGQMKSPTSWTGWTQLDSGVSSFGVQDVNNTDYVYDLRSSGQFWRGKEGASTAWTGWTQLDSGVSSFSVQDAAKVFVSPGSQGVSGGNSCDPIVFWIGSREEPMLTSPTFVSWIGKLIGANIS